MTDFREYQAAFRDHNDDLAHFGILGMKWGVRRYQNPDGSLTDEGLKRYRWNNPTGKYKRHNKKSLQSQEKLKELGVNPSNPTDQEKKRRLNLDKLDEKNEAYELKNRKQLAKDGFKMQINGNGYKRLDDGTYFMVGAWRQTGDDSAFNHKNYKTYIDHKKEIDKNIKDQYTQYLKKAKERFTEIEKYSSKNNSMSIESYGIDNMITVHHAFNYGDYFLTVSGDYNLENNKFSEWNVYID